ncbi:MAG: XdhC family protein, partial [Opitutales bacterium]
LEEHGFAVIMTHRYADDLQLLGHLLPRPLAYLGLLGPRRRSDQLLARLRADGFNPTPPMLAKLHSPVGLDLGGGTPEVVALSIVAEVQALLAGRPPVFLRDRPGSIHG